jgi:hypothetical protein
MIPQVAAVRAAEATAAEGPHMRHAIVAAAVPSRLSRRGSRSDARKDPKNPSGEDPSVSLHVEDDRACD